MDAWNRDVNAGGPSTSALELVSEDSDAIVNPGKEGSEGIIRECGSWTGKLEWM
jgi:hypothetical protein